MDDHAGGAGGGGAAAAAAGVDNVPVSFKLRLSSAERVAEHARKVQGALVPGTVAYADVKVAEAKVELIHAEIAVHVVRDGPEEAREEANAALKKAKDELQRAKAALEQGERLVLVSSFPFFPLRLCLSCQGGFSLFESVFARKRDSV